MNLPDFFGIDIGNSAIRVAQVKFDASNKPTIMALEQVQLDKPIVNLKDPATREYVISKIHQVKDAAGITTNKVVTALPEAMIFSKITSVPNIDEAQIEQLLFYELKNHIPVSPNEVQKDYISLGVDRENPKMLKILLIAAPKNLVDTYVNLLKDAKLEPIAIETETVALSRIMGYSVRSSQAYLVADFGFKGVDICLIKENKILFSQSIGTASESLTKAIAADYGITLQQAEQYKIKVGLLEDQADGKVLRSLIPIMSVITNELIKLINYFKTTMPENEPKQIYLVGEGAKLLGLENYISKILNIPCQKNDVVNNLVMPNKYKQQYAQTGTLGFTLSVGLAMKLE
jgi:type IV pilus assembly protein PilM